MSRLLLRQCLRSGSCADGSGIGGAVRAAWRTALQQQWVFHARRVATQRDLGNGWHAVYSAEHGREYYWNRSTGATSWESPGVGKVAVALTHGVAEAVGGASSSSAVPFAQVQPDAARLATDTSATKTVSAADSPNAATSVRLRARDLPKGWVAVFSPEHDREYFWHRPSGETSWEPPPRPSVSPEDVRKSTAAATQALLSGPSAINGVHPRRLRARVAAALRTYDPGEELRPDDFKLLRELLEYHPESAAKVGVGVRGIKVDKSLHESASNCFWVLRVDGTVEDFSARKCLDALPPP